MATIRINSLPADASPTQSDVLPIDGSSTRKVTIQQVAEIGRPVASQAEAEAGTDPSKAMTPLTTKQSIASEVGVSLASKAQGDLADSAVQFGDLSAVATSGDYDDLSNKPTLGSAAATDSTDYATAAQGATADTAVQPEDLAAVATSGDYSDLANPPTLGTAAAADTTDFATAAQGAKADSALQSANIGSGSDLSIDPEKLAKRGDVGDAIDAVRTFSTISDAGDYAPGTAPDFIRTAGYSSAGDGGGALYKKVASEPSHEGKFSITLSDGTTTVWYALAEMLPTPEMFGAPKDGTNDDAVAINKAFVYAQALKRPQVMLSGEYRLNTTIIPKSGVMLRGTSGAARLNSHTSVAYEVSTANAPLQHGGISGVAFINSDDTDVNAVAIKLDACQHCVFEHVYAEGYDAGTVVNIQPQILQANLPGGLDGLTSEGMNFIFNKFDQFLVTKCAIGFSIAGGADAGPITNVVTANEYHGITLRSVTQQGLASFWWHDNDRFYDWHINITADNAACVALGTGASAGEYVGVSAHHFYGLTMVRDTGVSWTGCYGLALKNTPGILATIGSDLNWPVPGGFIYNPYGVEIDVRGSYLHQTFADDDYDGTTPADTNRLGHISQSTLTDQHGVATVPSGSTGFSVDFPQKMYATPDTVNVTPRKNPGVHWWIDTIQADKFAIRLASALPADTDFGWEARVRDVG